MSIAEGKQHVLAGAMDEITPTSHIIQQRLGLLKGTTAGEGAQFFLLSAQKEEQTFAELKGQSFLLISKTFSSFSINSMQETFSRS